MPDWYKKVLIPLLDIIKFDIVARSVKIMDKIDYVFYVNGSLGTIDILKKYIEEWIQWLENEKVSLLTRKTIWSQKKPWQSREQNIRKYKS